MRVLVGCERSGIVRDAFRRYGHDAWSVDLEACEGDARWHFKADLFDVIGAHPVNRAYGLAQRDGWDILIVHPECRYLSVSGLHWNRRRPERALETDKALAFIERVGELRNHVKGFCLEQPDTCIATRLPELDRQFTKQRIQPFEFGDDASKATVLRLYGLPKLLLDPAARRSGRMVEWPRGSGKMVERWSNQCDSGQNILGPSARRAMDRARTYPGVAEAMARQWSRIKWNVEAV